MIPITDKRWLHREDIVRPMPGRDDDAATVDACWKYLEDQRSLRPPASPVTRGQAARAESELLRARVRARAIPGPMAGEMAAMRQTIDRLLAFVPTRAAPLADDRLAEIVRVIEREAGRLFGEGRASVQVEPEMDPDTSASHRVVVAVYPDEDFDPEVFATHAFALHRLIAGVLDGAELEAVRLIVDLA